MDQLLKSIFKSLLSSFFKIIGCELMFNHFIIKKNT